jgi:hypothetical protein
MDDFVVGIHVVLMLQQLLQDTGQLVRVHVALLGIQIVG